MQRKEFLIRRLSDLKKIFSHSHTQGMNEYEDFEERTHLTLLPLRSFKDSNTCQNFLKFSLGVKEDGVHKAVPLSLLDL